MSRRSRRRRSDRPSGSAPATGEAGAAGGAAFRAGCGRERVGPADLPELAYRDLAFPECPACPHRLEPDDAPPFCRWRPAGAAHPFAGLAGLRDALDDAPGDVPDDASGPAPVRGSAADAPEGSAA